MPRHVRSAAMATVIALNAMHAAIAWASPNTTALVDSMLSRAESIFSGQFTVYYSTGFEFEPDSRATRGPYVFSFSGSDWARRLSWTSTDRVVNRGQRQMQLWANPGTNEYGAAIEPPSSERKVCNDSSPRYVGTLWHETTLNWIRNHREQAVHAGSQLLDGDLETEVLEWNLVAEDCYQVVPEENALTADKTGMLRIYVCSKFGFTLPRIDRLAEDGTLAFRVESKDFQHAGDEIWIPRQSRWQWYDPAPGYYQEYELIEFSKINESIPESDFQFQVPAGTLLADHRDASAEVVVTIRELSDEARIGQLISEAKDPREDEPPVRNSNVRMTRSLLILIGCNVIAVAALTGLMIYRKHSGRQS